MSETAVHTEFLTKMGWQDFTEGLQAHRVQIEPEILQMRDYLERYLVRNPLSIEAHKLLIGFHLFYENFATASELCFVACDLTKDEIFTYLKKLALDRLWEGRQSL